MKRVRRAGEIIVNHPAYFMSISSGAYQVALLGLFLLALTARIIFLYDYASTDPFPLLFGSDSYHYLLWAQDIKGGNLIGGAGAFLKWPLYAYALALYLKISGGSPLAIYTVQVIMGAASVILTAHAGTRLFSRGVGLLSGLLSLSYGLFLFYEGLLIYTSLVIFLGILLLHLFISLRDDPRPGLALAAGLLTGVCALAQANVLLFGGAVLLWVMWEKKLRLGRWVTGLITFAAGIALTVGPVTLRNYMQEGDLVLISGNNGVNFYLGNNPEADGTFYTPLSLTPTQEGMFRDARIIAEHELDRRLTVHEVSGYWSGKAMEFIAGHPASFLRLTLVRAAYLFNPWREFIHDPEYGLVKEKIRIFRFMFMSLVLILPLAVAGMFLNLPRWREQGILYIFVATYGISMSLFFITTRYRVTIVPVLAIFASAAVHNLLTAACRRDIRRGAMVAAVMILSAILLAANRGPSLEVGSQAAVENRQLVSINRARILERKGDFDGALGELAAAEQEGPPNRFVKQLRGVVYHRLGDEGKAEQSLREALVLFPLYVDALYNLGFILNGQGRHREAVEFLERAVDLDPSDRVVHYELGKAYRALGDRQRAQDEYREAMKTRHRSLPGDTDLILKELRELESAPDN